MFGRVVLEVLKHCLSKCRELHIQRNSFTLNDLNFNNIVVVSTNLAPVSWRFCRSVKPVPLKEILMFIIRLNVTETRKYQRVESLLTGCKQKFRQYFRFRQRHYPSKNRIKKRRKEFIGFYLPNKTLCGSIWMLCTFYNDKMQLNRGM